MARRVPTWERLTSLAEDQLIDEHDKLVTRNRVLATTTYYLEELRHRTQARVAVEVERFTRRIFWLTLLVTVATIVNVGVAVWPGVRCLTGSP